MSLKAVVLQTVMPLSLCCLQVADVVLWPDRSIIKQSYDARERKVNICKEEDMPHRRNMKQNWEREKEQLTPVHHRVQRAALACAESCSGAAAHRQQLMMPGRI
jgi:hypothetical protein